MSTDQKNFNQFLKAVRDENIPLIQQMIKKTKMSCPNESIINYVQKYCFSHLYHTYNHKIAKILIQNGAKMRYGNYYHPPVLLILLRFPMLEEFIFQHVINNYQEFIGELMLSEQVYDHQISLQLHIDSPIKIQKKKRILELCEYVYLEKKNPYGNILLSKKQMVIILQNKLNVNHELTQLCLNYLRPDC